MSSAVAGPNPRSPTTKPEFPKGKIDLKAPIGTYLADYPRPTADKVTIHNLLTHTSGIPNYTSIPSVWKELTRDPYKPLDFMKIFSGEKLEFEPGSKFKYSNSGYFLLGVAATKLSKRSQA